jgi:hypothetical protein
LPNSTLKKQVSANNYLRVKEAVASRIASIVHCDTKYNLADMGSKSLNGASKSEFSTSVNSRGV